MILGIYGYGKMGRSIHKLSPAYYDIKSILIYGSNDNDLRSFLTKSDVILDFSISSATEELIEFILRENIYPKALLIGTTALSEKTSKQLENISKKAAVLKAANVSIGANLQALMCQKIAKIFGSGYDVDIIETHHKEKLDAPSGTAKMIAESLNSAFVMSGYEAHEIITDRTLKPLRGNAEISISSIRSGNAAGEHKVMFTGVFDSLTITHKVENRELLADGALKAGIWLSCQPNGSYLMTDYLSQLFK